MLWIISSLVFILLRVAPGDPVDAILGSGADEFSREFLRNKLGLNEPLISQYFSYIKNILHLDFGQSLSTQEPVLNIILKSLPASLELGFFSILSAIISSLIGIYVSFWFDLETGGSIVLVQTFIFLFAFLFAPRYGIFKLKKLFASYK